MGYELLKVPSSGSVFYSDTLFRYSIPISYSDILFRYLIPISYFNTLFRYSEMSDDIRIVFKAVLFVSCLHRTIMMNQIGDALCISAV